MDKTYCYTAIAGWNGSERNAAGAPEITRVIPFSAPPEFGGQASVWSPEHLLLGAVATCYVSTFRAIAGFSKLTFRAIDVSAEGTIEKQEGGLRFTRITLKPVVTIERGRRPGTRAEDSGKGGARMPGIALSGMSGHAGAKIELEEAVAAE